MNTFAFAYGVQPGDTLSGIAVKFGVTLVGLELTNPQIPDPNQIFPGQVITIPPTYVVQPGDTLSGIAQKYHVTLGFLEVANPQFTDPNLIVAGQVVTVPVPPTAPPHTYVVQPGDTLNGIANQFGVTLAALEAANPQIADPNLIFPGQVIVVPATVKTYVVQSGDTLSGIANQFNVSLALLEKANPQIANPNLIFPGQLIAIP